MHAEKHACSFAEASFTEYEPVNDLTVSKNSRKSYSLSQKKRKRRVRWSRKAALCACVCIGGIKHAGSGLRLLTELKAFSNFNPNHQNVVEIEDSTGARMCAQGI